MPSTKDIALDLGTSSFFLIGDSGSGKTRLAGTFPSPYFFDFDKGMASLAGVEGIDYDTFKDAPAKGKALKSEDGIYEYGTAWEAFIKRMNEIGEQIDKGTCPYKTLVFDSATLMAQTVMNSILKRDGKAGQNPEIQHYGTESTKLKEAFDQITSWPLIKVVTAHIQRNTNELLNTTEMLPLLTGKFAARSAIYFDEVYFVEVERKAAVAGANPKPAEHKYVLRTQSTNVMRQARSRFGVPDGTRAHFSDIRAAVAASKKAKVSV